MSESEPNASPRTADPLPAAYDGVTRFAGVLRRPTDVDTFRFTAWQSGKLKIDLSQRGDSPAVAEVYRSNGRRIARTKDGATVSVERGSVLHIKLRGGGPNVARYGVLLRQSGIAVSDARRATLGRGVNVDNWFWNQSGPDDTYTIFSTYFTDQDAKMLRSSGFSYVRLPVDVKHFVDWSDPSRLNPDALAALDRAISLLIDNGLAVLVSPFGSYNDRVIWPEARDDVLTFVRQWTRHLSKFDPERLFLQTANEPAGHPGQWLPVQESIVRVMRRAAPRHTIVTAATLRASADPADFGSLNALVSSKPLPDPNVVYSYHYYAPYLFTAQGAEWAWPGYGYLRYVPYPSSPEGVEWLATALDGEISNPMQRDVISSLRTYGQSYWNRDTLYGQIKLVKDWADYWQVPVVQDEFGVMSSQRVNPADRARWIGDVRSIAEEFGFGWAMWDYSGDYALTEGDWGRRTLRQDVLAALGLPR